MFFKSPIFISLSPNVEKDDIWLALKLIFCPWKWKRGQAVKLLEKEFERFLSLTPPTAPISSPRVHGCRAFAFNSGRSAFLAILKGLGLEKGDEVLLQAFTCNAAVNPIIWSGLNPVFVDIEKETLNIDPAELEKRITPKSKVVLLQHTFGLPAKIDEILEICERRNLILIEDCAHSLGAVYKGRKVGTFGRAAFFSLGRDKIISSVYGGLAVTKDKELAGKIKEFQEKYPLPSCCWILQQLLHPVITKIFVMPLYRFWGLGKYKLIALQKLGVLSKAVHKKEKQGKQPKYLPQKMPNALAVLGLNQFKKLGRFNKHRSKIANIYDSFVRVAPAQGVTVRVRPVQGGLAQGRRVYMRYSVLVEGNETDDILKFFRKHKILLDDGWRKSVIVPPNTDQEKMGYKQGSCPIAEEVADKIINLPTHINISLETAQKLKKLLQKSQK